MKATNIDPRRCQGTNLQGDQCRYFAVEGQQYCTYCSPAVNKLARKEANMYRLGQYQSRVSEFANDDRLKSLQEEIGIVRMLMEETLKQCHTPQDIIIYAGKLSDFAMKIGALLKTCQKLDVQLGATLDRDKVMLIGQKIVDILSVSIPKEHHHLLDNIGMQIATAVMEISLGNSNQNGQ